MAKAIGPVCNLKCRYCFYLEKTSLYEADECWKMPDAALEIFIRDYIAAQPGEHVSFAFQGGEPTLLGLKNFEKIIAYQKKHARGKHIENALQTNGTLIDDKWAHFLAENQFLVGISIDGPEELHNAYRVDPAGHDTFKRVFQGIKMLQKHGVSFNTLSCVNAITVKHPAKIYKFLKGIGSKYLQFIPIVEREVDTAATKLGLEHSAPPDLRTPPNKPTPPKMSPWAVPAYAYGDFLIRIYNEWIQRDVGKIFVQLFDCTLNQLVSGQSTTCVFAETCGNE